MKPISPLEPMITLRISKNAVKRVVIASDTASDARMERVYC